MTHIGIADANQRAALILDLMPMRLSELQELNADDVKDVCESFADQVPNGFTVCKMKVTRLQSLCLWVHDMVRAGAPVEFANGKTAEELLLEIREATARAKRRKDMKKIGEGLIDTTFNNKLKTQSQWAKFNEELNSTLSMIIGVKGVPLSYVIRKEEAPAFDGTLPYDKAVIQGTAITGPAFVQDAQTVHRIILHNVPENSDAYTYLKPVLRRQDGRDDMLRLRDRFDTTATKQAMINTAKNTLENLRYKSERNFSFEKFTARLQGAYDDLADNGRPVNNGDIVDALWARIQAPELQSYLNSLKVEYQRSERDYKLILQDIAGEVSVMKPAVTSGFRNVSEATVSATYTKSGSCPSKGVFTESGEIYIGNYGRDRWFAEDVKPYHQQIRDARKESGNKNKGSTVRTTKSIKRKRKQLEKLKVKISAAKQKVQELKEKQEESADDDGEESTDDNAGNAFGGKDAKRSKKSGKKG